ncbi:MAG: glycosyltransferase [Desulfohalobiaceae bacterium]
MFVLHVETGRHLYGGGRQVLYLLQGLKEMQAGSHVLVCAAGSDLASKALEFADQVYSLPLAGDLDLRFAWRLTGLLRRLAPDILHVHSRGAAELWAGLAATGSRTRTVLSRRVDNPEPWWQVRLKYALFDRVIPISQGIKQVLLRQGLPASKLCCVPSGVDTDHYYPGCSTEWFRQEFRLDKQDIVLGVVAQLIPRKGHAYLLQALPKILESYPRVKLLLFGQGHLQSDLQQQVMNLGLQDVVHFAGFRKDLKHILPCLEMLIHPALLEGLGVSLLQAAAAGLPIIATRTGGIPEIVLDNKTGLLVEPGQSDALAKAILYMLRHPEQIREMGQKGRELVCNRFSRQHMAQGNLQVYHQLLS